MTRSAKPGWSATWKGIPAACSTAPQAGTTLHELLARDPVAILGPAASGQGRFPLLLKFIDSRQELSVQVHPNDEQAARLGPGMFGKTEAWVILECSATSRIYSGVREGVTASQFRTCSAR